MIVNTLRCCSLRLHILRSLLVKLDGSYALRFNCSLSSRISIEMSLKSLSRPHSRVSPSLVAGLRALYHPLQIVKTHLCHIRHKPLIMLRSRQI